MWCSETDVSSSAHSFIISFPPSAAASRCRHHQRLFDPACVASDGGGYLSDNNADARPAWRLEAGCAVGRAEAERQQVRHYANERGSAAAAPGPGIQPPPSSLHPPEQLVPPLSAIANTRSLRRGSACDFKASGGSHVRYNPPSLTIIHPCIGCATAGAHSSFRLVKPALHQRMSHSLKKIDPRPRMVCYRQ